MSSSWVSLRARAGVASLNVKTAWSDAVASTKILGSTAMGLNAKTCVILSSGWPVARDVREYVDIAVRLGRDRAYREDLGRRLKHASRRIWEDMEVATEAGVLVANVPGLGNAGYWVVTTESWTQHKLDGFGRR